ncbi:MAG: hypothetical protein MZV70_62490 [Desulfobacterales bacterium]|nr:hypothetical protein [Desulfobacterales bacterium]
MAGPLKRAGIIALGLRRVHFHGARDAAIGHAILRGLVSRCRSRGSIVSASHDRKFFDTFMLVLGILLGITIGLIILARVIAGPQPAASTRPQTQVFQRELAGAHRAGRARRRRRRGQFRRWRRPAAERRRRGRRPAGRDRSTTRPAWPATAPASRARPSSGDKAAWAPRIAQGMDTLHTHALAGLPGQGRLHAAEGRPHRPVRPVGHQRGRLHRRRARSNADESARRRHRRRAIAARRPRRGGLRLGAAAARVHARPGRRLLGLPDLRLGAGAGRGRSADAAAADCSTGTSAPPSSTRCGARGYVEAADESRPAHRLRDRERRRRSRAIPCASASAWAAGAATSAARSTSAARACATTSEGTLVIHAIDAARNAEVWQGRVSGRIGKGSLEPAAVTAAVATAMRDFPARPAP